jgi:glutamate synthase domain-containing protein 1
MCGIVGLLVKKPGLRHQLGAWATPMFVCMADRGPDSGGMAVFGCPQENAYRISLFVRDRNYDWRSFLESFRRALSASDAEIQAVENHGILITSLAPSQVKAWLAECDPSPLVLSVGRSMDIFKDQGNPRDIARRYHFTELSGTHCVGHTRMATESAVTPAHSHPFTAGEDFCLVHNGSLSNPYMLCRMLEKQGVRFETDNDTEAACRFIEWRLREGDSLNSALERAFEELDGFYTLLMATADQMTLVRDAFACKPAVVAETDDYVAISSEFRSLAHLPGVAEAKIFEPQPETIYSWRV